MLRLLLPVLLLGLAGEARAQFLRDCDGPVWMTATLASRHFDRQNDYEELNVGVGFEHVCGDWRGVGGVFRNSNRRTSLYVGGAWMPLSWRELHAGLFGGLFSGYSTSLLPAGAFVGAWEGRRYGIDLLFFPPIEEFKGLLVLRAKRKF